MSKGISAEVVGAGVLPDMSMPSMSPEWVGAGVLPDMSMPSMSPEWMGAGVLPDMSMPSMSPEWVAVGELADASFEPWLIPDMADEVDLTVSIVTATTPARTRTTAEITNKRIAVLLFMEVIPKVVAMLWAWERPAAQVSPINIGPVPRGFPVGFHEGSVKDGTIVLDSTRMSARVDLDGIFIVSR